MAHGEVRKVRTQCHSKATGISLEELNQQCFDGVNTPPTRTPFVKRSLEPNSLQSRQHAQLWLRRVRRSAVETAALSTASAELCWRQGSPGKDQLNDHADIERESFLLLGKDEVDRYGETGNRYLGRYLA